MNGKVSAASITVKPASELGTAGTNSQEVAAYIRFHLPGQRFACARQQCQSQGAEPGSAFLALVTVRNLS